MNTTELLGRMETLKNLENQIKTREKEIGKNRLQKECEMQGADIEKKIISYREDSNDYRLCLTREDMQEIKKALDQKALIDEIRDLVHEETCQKCEYNKKLKGM